MPPLFKTRNWSGLPFVPILMSPPPPRPLSTLVVSWLSTSNISDEALGEVIVTFPPGAALERVVMELFRIVSESPNTMLTLPASASGVPVLVAEIVPPLLRLIWFAPTVMSPPAPVPDASENSPAPSRVREPFAVLIVMVPPWPDPDVPLSIRAPLATLVVAASITMLPAAPAPVVATEIRPPLSRARRVVETLMEPAAPAPESWLDVVLKRPDSVPVRVRELAAATARLPPL